MFKLLRGIGMPPGWVGSARALVELVLMGGLVGATVWLGEVEDLEFMAPIGIVAIRFLEGIVDQIDPAKQRRP